MNEHCSKKKKLLKTKIKPCVFFFSFFLISIRLINEIPASACEYVSSMCVCVCVCMRSRLKSFWKKTYYLTQWEKNILTFYSLYYIINDDDFSLFFVFDSIVGTKKNEKIKHQSMIIMIEFWTNFWQKFFSYHSLRTII